MLNSAAYHRLLAHYQEYEYTFKFFENFDPFGSKQILLRHDVDFDIYMAWWMAKLEYIMEVKSTYFFLTHSDAYNILSPKSINMIQEIRLFGHRIGLHFDPELKFEEQLRVFQLATEYEDQNPIVSIHRPRMTLNVQQPFWSTYEDRYFKNITYVSDSRCVVPNKIMNNGQLLIHPIWWYTQAGTMVQKLNKLVRMKGQKFKEHIADNIRSLDIKELKELK